MSFNNVPLLSQVHSGVQPVSTEHQVQINNYPNRTWPDDFVEACPGDLTAVHMHNPDLLVTDIIFARSVLDVPVYGPNAEALSALADTVIETFATSTGGCTCQQRFLACQILWGTAEQKNAYNKRQLMKRNGEYTCILFERLQAWFREHHHVTARQLISPGITRVEMVVCCDDCVCSMRMHQIANRMPVCNALHCADLHSN